MELEKRVATARILLPPDFAPQLQVIEYRRDPLTGSRTLINIRRAERAKQAEAVSRPSEEVTVATARGCPFCPERVEEATPRFPPEVLPEGRLRRGQCLLFPNMYAFGEYHAVALLSRAHFLDLDEFTQRMIVDNLLAAQEWMRAVHRRDRGARWPVYIWNHMPPSGASIVHPHTQLLLRRFPTPMQSLLIRRSRAIYRHTITLSLEGEAYRSSARASDSRWLQAEMLGVTSNARLTLEATLTRLQAGEAWPVTSGPHWQALVREFEQLTAALSQPLKPVTLPVPAESEAGG